MLDHYLAYETWDEAPQDMDFEESLGDIMGALGDLVGRLSVAPEADAATGALARRLLLRAPALVNVLLNYKICAEHGLPFHPTVYYELKEAKRYAIPHDIGELEGANRLYRESIELARAALRLEAGFATRLEAFRSSLPEGLLGFVYSGRRDFYTWRGTDLGLIGRLAEKIRGSWAPDIIVAAAHGAIMPALLLAESLGLPLYFIRFSMFKRNDEAPIVSLADEAWLWTWREGKALLFDEDVAGGRTLSLFSERLGPLFKEGKTACVIRHAGSSIRPDFVGRVWFD